MIMVVTAIIVDMPDFGMQISFDFFKPRPGFSILNGFPVEKARVQYGEYE